MTALTYHAKVGMRKASRVRTIEALRVSLDNATAAGDHVLANAFACELYTVEYGYWPPNRFRGVAYDKGGLL